ncbi:unnamed protein product [Arabidopsis lyrata]|nr:unnamed protein product [Arabidopsis lyrata]
MVEATAATVIEIAGETSDQRIGVILRTDENQCHVTNSAKLLDRIAFTGSSATSISDTNNVVDPRTLMFKKNMYRKPEVDWQNYKNCDYPPLHFNISHTDSLIACGVTVHVPVGIDLEDKERKIKHDVLALAERFYSTDEVKFLSTIPNPEVQRKEFIKLWTLKEAYVKALGKGFSAAPFNTFTIQSKAGTAGGYNLCKEKTKKCNGEWKFGLLELADSHYAAICIEDDQASGGAPLRVIVRKTILFVEDELISESRFL